MVDDAGDNAWDSGGIDTVMSSVSYRLAAQSGIEILRTGDDSGTGLIDLTGNTSATQSTATPGTIYSMAVPVSSTA